MRADPAFSSGFVKALAFALISLLTGSCAAHGQSVSSADGTIPKTRIPLKVNWIAPLTDHDKNPPFRPMEFASPTLFGDRMYVGQSNGQFFALSAKTGREIWRFDAYGPVEGSPAADGSVVVFGDSDGVVYALDAQTGFARWTAFAVGEIMGRPLISDGRVYFATTYNRIYCLDLADGKWLWTHQRDVPATFTVRGVSSPVVRDGVLFAGFSDGYFIALHAESGKEIWKNLLKLGERLSDVDATPVIEGDRLYTAAYDGDLYCLSLAAGEVLWMMKDGESVSRPALKGDALYFSSSRGFVIAVDKATGKSRWQTDIREADREGSLASSPRLRRKNPTGPVILGDVLIAASNQEFLYALDVKTGAILWRYHPGYGVSGEIVADGNQIYFLGNAGGLFAMAPQQFLSWD